MSSYFDRMGAIASDSTGRELVNLVYDQYRWYLRQLEEEVLVKDREKLYSFSHRLDEINLVGNPYWVIQEMHSLAHDLGRAQIRLRGKIIASDSPRRPY